MTVGQRAVLAGLACLAALTLSFGVMTAASLQQARAPLPTEASLPPSPTAAPTHAALTTAVGLVRLPPLGLAEATATTAGPDDPNAPAVRANPAPPATAGSAAYRFVVGHSRMGREIEGWALPVTGSPRGLVMVDGIHGDEVNARPSLERLFNDFASGSLAKPDGLSIYLISSLNPDGTAGNQRFDAAGIDLNRNWDTYDWRSAIDLPAGVFLAGGGGPAPFSEPETQAMRNLLIQLGATHTGGLAVLYFHAAAPPRGLVTPGTRLVGGQEEPDNASRQLGQALADIAGYDYSDTWLGGYTVTGDATTWAVAQGYQSLTVELPTNEALAAPDADHLYAGVLAAVNYFAGH